MKKCFIIVLAICGVATCFAQNDTTLPADRRVPVVPPFDVLMADSITHYTKANLPKNKPLLIILFDPNCDHCKHETENILKSIDSFKTVQIVMVTNASFSDMRTFYNNFNLVQFKNIVVGIEPKYFLATFFMIGNLPYLAMYDRKGKLITTHEGSMKVEKILDVYR